MIENGRDLGQINQKNGRVLVMKLRIKLNLKLMLMGNFGHYSLFYLFI